MDVVLAGDLARDTLLDEQYFRQIMLNLILNAIDVSKGGDAQFCLPCREDDEGGGPSAEERMVEGANHRTAPAKSALPAPKAQQ